jgi:hypothetical protein
MPDFPRPLLFREHRPQRVVLKKRIRSRMKLIKVNALNAQRPEGILQLTPNFGGAENVITFHEPAEVVAEFCRHNPTRPIAPGQVFPNQPFRRMIPITLGRIDEIDAIGGGLIENGIRLILGKDAPPLPAQLPGSDPDHRHSQPSLAKNSITHETK